MTPPIVSVPKPVVAGILLAMFAILFGFGLGLVFGAAESQVKQTLQSSGTAALDAAYQGDVAKKDAVVAKSWQYLLRAHLHGGAIGAAALGSIAILLLVTRLGLLAQASALSFGAGALLYAVFWLLAGFKAPGMGSTGAAKEALNLIAVPGAGLAVLGLVGSIIAVVKDTLLRHRPGVS